MVSLVKMYSHIKPCVTAIVSATKKQYQMHITQWAAVSAHSYVIIVWQNKGFLPRFNVGKILTDSYLSELVAPSVDILSNLTIMFTCIKSVDEISGFE